MAPPAVHTALVEVTSLLPDPPPCRIFFKNEYEQPSGLFKLRGMSTLILNLIDAASKAGKRGLHAFLLLGGNAGLAAAFVALYYQIPCTVVLPKSTKEEVAERLRSFGASVEVFGAHWGEADTYLREKLIPLLDESVYPVYCHPFDDPLMWEGHGTVVDEIVDAKAFDASKLRGVVCSVGGGGLYNGVVEGLDRRGLKVPVLAVETSQAPTFLAALLANKVVHLKSINTLATSLASPYISQQSLDNYDTHHTIVAVVDDLDAVRGAVDFYDTFNVLVEPACGATVSVAFRQVELLQKLGPLKKDDVVVCIVCGGSGTSKEMLTKYRSMF